MKRQFDKIKGRKLTKNDKYKTIGVSHGIAVYKVRWMGLAPRETNFELRKKSRQRSLGYIYIKIQMIELYSIAKFNLFNQ